MIRSHLFAEEREPRVAICSGHVAEDLVVGTIFLDDIKYVPDRISSVALCRKVALTRGNPGSHGCGLLWRPVRHCLVRMLHQPLRGNEGNAPAKQSANPGIASRIRMRRIGTCDFVPAICDIQTAARR